jgi:hypothetical protein
LPDALPPAIPITYASTFFPSGPYHGARPCDAITTFLLLFLGLAVAFALERDTSGA